jgi:hypothetical protein
MTLTNLPPHYYLPQLKSVPLNSKGLSVRLCLIVCALLSTIGCSNKASQASRDLAANITRSLPARTREQTPEISVEEKRVYLDASLSMKGFVNSEQHSQFDEFIEAVGDAMPGCQIYKYGLNGNTAPKGGSAKPNISERTNFGMELHRPDFYNLAYNPDDLLIEQLTAEDRPVLSVLITDGVYSEPQGASAPPVVQAIQDWMSKGRVFGVLTYRSEFKGQLYTERGRTFLPKNSVKARPFHAFVFSPTVRAFRELQEKLSKRFPEMQTFLFSDEAVSCSPKINGSLKGTYSFKAPPEVPYFWQMFGPEIFGQSNPSPVGYNITCTIAPDYPAAELKFDLAHEYYRWDKTQFKKVETGAPTGFRYEPRQDAKKDVPVTEAKDARSKPSSSPPDVVVYFPKDTGGDYGFYYLKWIASLKSLRPEIEALSTRDDRNPTDAGKTFRFYELMDALTEIHFKTRLASNASTAFFVTISNH